MSTFFYPYVGNKRAELKYIDFEIIKGLNIVNIVEPFCGSASFSNYCFCHDIGQNYFINDTDKDLITFLKEVKRVGDYKFVEYYNENKERDQFDEIKKKSNKTMYDKFYMKRISSMCYGMYPTTRKLAKCAPREDLNAFFKKAIITNNDYKILLKEHKTNIHSLLFLDPPYFDSSNRDYAYYGTDENNMRIDGTKMYIYILKYLKTCKCKVILILASNAIINYLFQDFIICGYKKLYARTKKSTVHLIISNIKHIYDAE